MNHHPSHLESGHLHLLGSRGEGANSPHASQSTVGTGQIQALRADWRESLTRFEKEGAEAREAAAEERAEAARQRAADREADAKERAKDRVAIADLRSEMYRAALMIIGAVGVIIVIAEYVSK